MRILVADESVAVRDRIIEGLSNWGDVEVSHFSGGESGIIKFISTFGPDIIILALGIYNYQGVEVLKIIKGKYPFISVIMISNFPFPEYRQMCMDSGADYYFDETFEIDEILNTVLSMKLGRVSTKYLGTCNYI